MALFASFKTTKVQASVVDIGGVSEVSGYAQVKRDSEPLNADLKLSIQSNDQAVTTNGRMAITFLDDSTVKLTEHSQLTIDEYIFDPDPSKSKMALTFGLGTARFISGKLGQIDKRNILLKTPVSNIAIRGTDFTATVDELGRSLIILLPNKYGVSSGEIEVITAMGSVLLNKPYEATTVSVFESAPSKPVILDLTLDFIDNMLIVTPPAKKDVIIDEQVIKTANILDFNDLDIDYLDEDLLAEDSLEFTELDINYLDVNFSGVTMTGTSFGADVNTQITAIITGQTLSLIRNVSEYTKLDLDISGGYTVILIQDGISNTIKINGGDSVIRITQEG